VLHVLSLDLHTSTRQTEAQIRSLLAHGVTGVDASGVASATWKDLLEIASTAMSEAGRLRCTDLSRELQNRHGPLGTQEQAILRAIDDHTAPVLRGIRSTIGRDLYLQAPLSYRKCSASWRPPRRYLVSGPAGSEKSVVGKEVISLLSRDYFAFGFWVEEFAQPHIDKTLHDGQIPANAKTLATILAAQGASWF